MSTRARAGRTQGLRPLLATRTRRRSFSGLGAIHRRGEDVRASVLQATPAVLSVGRRCMEHGYAFHWEPWQDPVLICPDGKVVALEVDQYVPYLVCLGTVFPAAAAVGDLPGGVASGSAGPEAVDDAPERDVDDVAVAPGRASGSAGPEAIDDAPECDVDDVAVAPGRDLKAEVVSRVHLMTHMPKNKWCPACQRAKMQHKACRSGSSLGLVPEAFGDQVTADHIVSRSEISQGLIGEKNALVLLDRATGYIDCFPLGTKNSDDAWDAFNEYLGPGGVHPVLVH